MSSRSVVVVQERGQARARVVAVVVVADAAGVGAPAGVPAPAPGAREAVARPRGHGEPVSGQESACVGIERHEAPPRSRPCRVVPVTALSVAHDVPCARRSATTSERRARRRERRRWRSARSREIRSRSRSVATGEVVDDGAGADTAVRRGGGGAGGSSISGTSCQNEEPGAARAAGRAERLGFRARLLGMQPE